MYLHTSTIVYSFRHLGQKGEFLKAVLGRDNILYTNYMPLNPYNEVDMFVIMLQSKKLK